MSGIYKILELVLPATGQTGEMRAEEGMSRVMPLAYSAPVVTLRIFTSQVSPTMASLMKF